MKKEINIGNVFLVIMCILMTRPYYVQLFSAVNTIWAYTALLVSIVSLAYIIFIKKSKQNKPLLLFFLIFFISTFLNNKSNIPSVISILGQAILAYNVGIIIVNAKSKKKMGIVRKYIIVLLLLDVISILLSISSRLFGLSKEMSFLGYDNYTIYSIISLITVEWYISYTVYGKICKTDLFCFILVYFAKIYTISVNAILILTLFLIEYLLIIYKKHLLTTKIVKFSRPRNIFVGSLFLFVGIVFFRIHYIFKRLLIAMGKGLTLNSRTIIWDHVIKNLHKSPIWGFGNVPNGEFQEIVGFNPLWDIESNHPHNLILSIMFCTGIIGSIVYWFMILSQSEKLMKNNWLVNSAILVLGLSLYMILGFFDAYPFVFGFYLMLSVLFNQSNKLKLKIRLGNVYI